ncbi:pyruvate dehydrogenase E2 component (dihydrolipoamide acetyltransferase) [Planomicrobium koreense]|uniref:Dihydrolipoamide acetyltransferase component of pyruvate dehydrogenase complex n=1 Tax=Planococcus koreensis TaxID=112331 RepID=A0A7W8FTV2_9BACL|nr:dihydrolipoamide acetyltransferase family protein [Planococcus koreensis]MBB5179905.1 pyruvate dehydrogenase E2 component (dihydrolipoamide acetyltransferase) [Planococcus koreensis]
MVKEIFMPKLSSTMEVGTLLQWFKNEGDAVAVGEPLFEIMTDKINIEVESYEEGILLKKYFEEDDEVPINHVVGYIGEAGEQVPDSPPGESGAAKEEEDVSDSRQPQLEDLVQQGITDTTSERTANEPAETEATAEKLRATPAARRAAREENVRLAEVPGSGPKGRIHQGDVMAFTSSHTALKATPLAKKVAEAEGVDLKEVSGTGSQGKIYRADVEGVKQIASSPVEAGGKRVKLEGIRKVVAQRTLQSKTTAPHVTLTTEVDMTEAINLRKQLLGPIEQQTGFRVSYTEIILKAAAYSLKMHPHINVALEGNHIIYHEEINLGLAVAADNGLLVPVVKNADQKGLAALTAECKRLGKAARENKVKPEEMSGGTFTVSNLGMYAIDAFTPVINQPESAILGVGRINEKPVGVNGAIELRPMMVLSLSFDHRVIDGAPAAAFLTELKEALEQPFKLLA